MSLRMTSAQLAALQGGAVEPTRARRKTNWRNRPSPGCLYWPMGSARTPPSPDAEHWRLYGEAVAAEQRLKAYREGRHA